MFYVVMCFVTQVVVVKSVMSVKKRSVKVLMSVMYKIDGIIVCMQILWSEGLKQIPKLLNKYFPLFQDM